MSRSARSATRSSCQWTGFDGHFELRVQDSLGRPAHVYRVSMGSLVRSAVTEAVGKKTASAVSVAMADTREPNCMRDASRNSGSKSINHDPTARLNPIMGFGWHRKSEHWKAGILSDHVQDLRGGSSIKAAVEPLTASAKQPMYWFIFDF